MLETPFYMEMVGENQDKLGPKPLNTENWLWVHVVSIYLKVETP